MNKYYEFDHLKGTQILRLITYLLLSPKLKLLELVAHLPLSLLKQILVLVIAYKTRYCIEMVKSLQQGARQIQIKFKSERETNMEPH